MKNGSMVDLRNILVLLGAGVALIISLSSVIGWQTQNIVANNMGSLENKYVRKEVFDLQIQALDNKISAIMRAVGARIRK